MEERSRDEPSHKETSKDLSKEESEVHDWKEDLIIHEIQNQILEECNDKEI